MDKPTEMELDIHVWIRGEEINRVACYTISNMGFPICYDMPKEQALEALGEYLEEKADELSSLITCEECGTPYDMDDVADHDVYEAEVCFSCHEGIVDADPDQPCHLCAQEKSIMRRTL